MDATAISDWDYLPGGNEPIIPPSGAGTWMEHARLNVVRSVKRGLSDFFPIQGKLGSRPARAAQHGRRLGRASGDRLDSGSRAGHDAGASQHRHAVARRRQLHHATSQGGSRTHLLQQYDPATILKVPSGQKYLPGPLGAQHAPNFITAAEALLRTVALRWNLPEHLVTGSAANNNYASSLVAETPFVKYAESQQQFYARRDRRDALASALVRLERRPLRRRAVAGSAASSLEITVTPPQIEVRDPEKETRVRQMLHAAGILSRKTWSAQESLDFEQEQKNFNVEGAHGAPSDDPRRMADSLEKENEKKNWDPDKHPRGGNPKNTGEFSEATGSGPSSGTPKQDAHAGGGKAAAQQAPPNQGGATSTVVNKGSGSANRSGEIKAYNPSILQRAWDYLSHAWNTDPARRASVTVNGKEYPAPPTLSPGQHVIGSLRYRLLKPAYSGVRGAVAGIVKAPGRLFIMSFRQSQRSRRTGSKSRHSTPLGKKCPNRNEWTSPLNLPPARLLLYP